MQHRCHTIDQDVSTCRSSSADEVLFMYCMSCGHMYLKGYLVTLKS